MTEEATPSLSFDTPAGPSTAACSFCAEPFGHTYFTIDGKAACPACRLRAAEALDARPGVRGWLKAVVLGSVPGFAGAIIWWAVRYFASLEIGLIAVGIGHFVGMGVRRGSGGRGGLRFQLLAVALTYFWITANYVPEVIAGLANAAPAQAAQAAAAPPPAPTGVYALLAVFVFLAVTFAIAMAAPLMMGLENIIGVLIIAFGLFQAWKLNAEAATVVEGPFQLAAASAAPLDEPGPAH